MGYRIALTNVEGRSRSSKCKLTPLSTQPKKCDARPDSLLDGRARTKSPKSMRYTGSRNATRLYEKNAQSIYQVF